MAGREDLSVPPEWLALSLASRFQQEAAVTATAALLGRNPARLLL